ncbi:MAG: ribosome silencing factor [Desulfonatronovibrionaceae bacterium]
MDENVSIAPKAIDDKLRLLGRWMEDKKGLDIRLLDVSRMSSFFEGVVLVTARNVRQARTMADNLLQMLKDNNLEYLGMEGYRPGDWVLIDLNDVIVHIFLEDTRSFYNLEGFWSRARVVEFGPGGGHGE